MTEGAASRIEQSEHDEGMTAFPCLTCLAGTCSAISSVVKGMLQQWKRKKADP
jgi:hypothetical protein